MTMTTGAVAFEPQKGILKNSLLLTISLTRTVSVGYKNNQRWTSEGGKVTYVKSVSYEFVKSAALQHDDQSNKRTI
jgi:hypothetical protein